MFFAVWGCCPVATRAIHGIQSRRPPKMREVRYRDLEAQNLILALTNMVRASVRSAAELVPKAGLAIVATGFWKLF